jgi:phosphoglucosamine mutase
MRSSGRALSELRGVLKKFPQGTRNLRVAEKRPLADCVSLVAELAAVERELGSGGRAVARFSGTEAKLRLLVEAEDEVLVMSALNRLESAARRDLPPPL